jgi:hypothetical protein
MNQGFSLSAIPLNGQASPLIFSRALNNPSVSLIGSVDPVYSSLSPSDFGNLTSSSLASLVKHSSNLIEEGCP